jgi:hypothetical protein
VDASQVFAWHVAGVSVNPSALQDACPLTVKAEVHVGWHESPAPKLVVQSPTPPLDGAVDASQVFAWHVAAVSVSPSELHDVAPVTVKAVLHVG